MPASEASDEARDNFSGTRAPHFNRAFDPMLDVEQPDVPTKVDQRRALVVQSELDPPRRARIRAPANEKILDGHLAHRRGLVARKSLSSPAHDQTTVGERSRSHDAEAVSEKFRATATTSPRKTSASDQVGSHKTLRCREMDSNLRFLVAKP